eukprot:CAMPEP_0206478524 /NCGR_PEP_ID=MMETSP0324_2-20121206/36095_1 /ASSEMBLY_ACC=CAM_ASM_000836 /TAXON_ID=2866 /ORGANISM="Crypthecodinium cohnii, Strain Seligo" /LENGTH=63 /DNA_ID=CAMNT_0053954827 /DNA_START=92 /DNA_END=280 /DNA_ORIENTATION=+
MRPWLVGCFGGQETRKEGRGLKGGQLQHPGMIMENSNLQEQEQLRREVIYDTPLKKVAGNHLQ